ncbi:MAG: Clp protease ClpP [Bacillota bacterium]
MKVNINGYIVPNDYKEVYDWFGIEAFCPNDLKSIKVAAAEPLEVIIGTCYGGSIFAGSEIGAEIASHPHGATIDIMGLAASAASAIAMYAKNRMAPTAMIMVHNVSSVAEGDYHAMTKEAEILKQANAAIAAAYTMKSGMSLDDALKMMDKETWLTAAQAKEKGLVDEVMFETTDPAALVATAGAGMIPRAVIEKTKEMLAKLKAPVVPEPDDSGTYDLAYAKLNFINKTM